MSPDRALAAEQAVALTAGVARDLIDQGSNRGLPRPRFLVAVFAFYGILGLLSAFGQSAARVAVAFGGVAALTTIVLGPGGITLAKLFEKLGGLTTPGSGKSPAGGESAPILGPTGSRVSAAAAANLNPPTDQIGPGAPVPTSGNPNTQPYSPSGRFTRA